MPRFVVAIAVIGIFSVQTHAQPRGRGERNGWLYSLSEGKTEARRTGKPLMVMVRCEP